MADNSKPMSLARQIVNFAIKAGSSDIHLEEGSPIAIRVNSDIRILENILGPNDMSRLLSEIVGDEKLDQFNRTGDLDTSIGLEGLSRIRINAYKANEKRCLTLRILPDNLPNWQDLGLPQPFIDLTEKHRGLVLCTGPTGSGKSTTLAPFINCILETQKRHILTIEDPIEFMHQNKKSIISQREVGRDTQSFARAIKAALREDPDIILLGELRDYETISLALTAAETGHLVFGTLHTSGASSTINRIIDAYPPQEQAQARSQLSTSLQMVLTQRLFKKKDGTGRVGAFEVMVCNSAIRNLIRESKIPQIDQAIETGASDGMINMKKYIENLVNNDLINQPKDIE